MLVKSNNDAGSVISRGGSAGVELPRGTEFPDRLIGSVAALAVATVAAIAGVIASHHAYELVRDHGGAGLRARLVPLTVDGLIVAASMLILDASRGNQPVPALARWCLGTGIVATIGANLAHGLGHGPIGALVSAWPALALAGSFELLMTLIRTGKQSPPGALTDTQPREAVPAIGADPPPALTAGPDLEQTIRAWHRAGHSQRGIARALN